MATRMARISDVVAGNLRALKATRRLTDDQIAQLMGVKRSWVQERLSGVRECKVSDLEAFARAFRVSADQLLYAPWDSNPEPNDSTPTTLAA